MAGGLPAPVSGKIAGEGEISAEKCWRATIFSLTLLVVRSASEGGSRGGASAPVPPLWETDPCGPRNEIVISPEVR